MSERPFVPRLSASLKKGLPVSVGPKASSGIILRGDTFVELGNPDIGSSAFVLWTDKTTLIRDGSITLIGPDIPESAGASLPFGQVLMVGGTGPRKRRTRTTGSESIYRRPNRRVHDQEHPPAYVEPGQS